ncbi:MAG: c-type cytochrome domain-containing protein [Verrucomicrobiales bacterium]
MLSDRCYACPGPDSETVKGALRLDLCESPTAPAKSGAIAIVPGRPDESAL